MKVKKGSGLTIYGPPQTAKPDKKVNMAISWKFYTLHGHKLRIFSKGKSLFATVGMIAKINEPGV
jgi:hypothetical protein